MIKLDELQFGLDYSISEDFLNLPGSLPPRLWGTEELKFIFPASYKEKERSWLLCISNENQCCVALGRS